MSWREMRENITFTDRHFVGSNLHITYHFEDELDTKVTFDGNVWIAGGKREEFLTRLRELIEETYI